jgi:TrmH family RNA methyltransferase
LIKVTSYKSDNIYTYGLGATVAMEYLLKKRDVVRAVILHPGFRSEETIGKIRSICGSDIPVSTEEKPFNILSKKDNCFVIAVIEKQKVKMKDGNHMVLVNPSNCGNLGTIVRSCLGFGVTNIAIVGKNSADPCDPKTIRASMGACASVNIEVFEDFADYQTRFPDNNLYPFMLDGSTKLQETTINKPFSLIMGNEATGLDPKFRDIGKPIRIEHSSDIDSLNITIAASIGLYEATKSCE